MTNETGVFTAIRMKQDYLGRVSNKTTVETVFIFSGVNSTKPQLQQDGCQ